MKKQRIILTGAKNSGKTEMLKKIAANYKPEEVVWNSAEINEKTKIILLDMPDFDLLGKAIKHKQMSIAVATDDEMFHIYLKSLIPAHEIATYPEVLTIITHGANITIN